MNFGAPLGPWLFCSLIFCSTDSKTERNDAESPSIGPEAALASILDKAVEASSIALLYVSDDVLSACKSSLRTLVLVAVVSEVDTGGGGGNSVTKTHSVEKNASINTSA